jgi:hypothetical protein
MGMRVATWQRVQPDHEACRFGEGVLVLVTRVLPAAVVALPRLGQWVVVLLLLRPLVWACYAAVSVDGAVDGVSVEAMVELSLSSALPRHYRQRPKSESTRLHYANIDLGR